MLIILPVCLDVKGLVQIPIFSLLTASQSVMVMQFTLTNLKLKHSVNVSFPGYILVKNVCVLYVSALT